MVTVQREKAWLLGSDGAPKPAGFRDLGRKPNSSRFNSPVDMMTLAPIKSAENQEGISFL